MLILAKKTHFYLFTKQKKQKEWLELYGIVITCMDGVYKTLRYGFPCYFLVVKTSIRIGRVVGTIIPQYETEELIAEGLRIIKLWSSRWSPRFFMTDKSSQEHGMGIYKRYCVWVGDVIGSIGVVHPKCFRLVCDFHSLQAVERWINKSSYCVKFEDKASVKLSFRTLLYATSSWYCVVFVVIILLLLHSWKIWRDVNTDSSI